MFIHRAILKFLLILPFSVADEDEKITCANLVGYIAHIAEDGGRENISTEADFVQCKYNYCYTLWSEDPTNGTKIVMSQGCWDTSGKPNECENSECIARTKPPKAMNNTIFCCCSTSKCNVNFVNKYVPADDPPPSTEAPSKESLSILVWILCSLIFIVLAGTILVLTYCIWQRKPKKEDVEHGEVVASVMEYDLDKLKLLNVIGQGRYGSVWKGLIDTQEVAVKVFPSHHRNYFINEHEMYKLSGENSALLKCYGGAEYVLNSGGPTDYCLILSLEQECLQDYLKNHTVDLSTLSRMSLGVAKGLAHLHSDLGKPCIAHRDVNTRNVLVRVDLSCCVCDLGLAVVPRGTENRSLTEAGTLRYMAPEVLEGAVNLRDCESALKQIDVYALGLVLWEIGMRCADMQNGDVQPYAPPFLKEAGENPTLEQMQSLVSRRKARPLWPPSWKDTAAARLLRETAEDCWDQDAEARLTSLCVVERLLELPSLKGRILHPLHPPSSPTPLINNNHLHDHPVDASVGTIETLLSPSEENCKNSNQFAACVTPLQPYQGRNPCLERNLHSESSDSLLIDKSMKHSANSDTHLLVTSDFLNFQINHRALPIPYVQNAVHGSPKQPNITNEAKHKFKWNWKKLFHNKRPSASNRKQTQVKLVNTFGQNGVTTSLLSDFDQKRPSTLPLSVAKPQENTLAGIAQLAKRKNSLSRQRSLDQFNEVFSSSTDLSRLKDPSQRVKTPGDVPPSVRRTRGKAAKESSARFSLYDDRMMCNGQWGSAPDLEPQISIKTHQVNDVQDRDSVSSF